MFSLDSYSVLDSLCEYLCYLGVEPWTFEQNLGEAVFIPAGCPHQVRNLKVLINTSILILCTISFSVSHALIVSVSAVMHQSRCGLCISPEYQGMPPIN